MSSQGCGGRFANLLHVIYAFSYAHMVLLAFRGCLHILEPRGFRYRIKSCLGTLESRVSTINYLQVVMPSSSHHMLKGTKSMDSIYIHDQNIVKCLVSFQNSRRWAKCTRDIGSQFTTNHSHPHMMFPSTPRT